MMVEPKAESIKAAHENARNLHEAGAKSGVLDLMEATRARSRCLKELTLARRPKFVAAPAAGKTDELLQELSESGKVFAFRDDRGVVVVLRGLLVKSELTTEAKELLLFLGRVSKAHPDFPVMLVGHAGSTREDPEPTVKAAESALKAAGAGKVEVQVVGSALPVVDPERGGAKLRNSRLEVVFVSPAP
jgi:hypothetical protein